MMIYFLKWCIAMSIAIISFEMGIMYKENLIWYIILVIWGILVGTTPLIYHLLDSDLIIIRQDGKNEKRF